MSDNIKAAIKESAKQSVANSLSNHSTDRIMATLLSKTENVPSEFLDKSTKQSGIDVKAGHRGDRVDLIAINGTLLYGTKLDMPEYAATGFPYEQMFEVSLYGLKSDQMSDSYGLNGKSQFTAKPVSHTNKKVIPVKHRSPSQAAVSKMIQDTKSPVNPTTGTQCSLSSNKLSLREALEMQKMPKVGRVTFIAPPAGGDPASIQNASTSESPTFTVDGNKSELKNIDGTALQISGGKVRTFGDVSNSSANVDQPQQFTGIQTKRNPVDDIVPRSNVLMPNLKRIPDLDDIISLVVNSVKLYKLAINISKLIK